MISRPFILSCDSCLSVFKVLRVKTEGAAKSHAKSNGWCANLDDTVHMCPACRANERERNKKAIEEGAKVEG